METENPNKTYVFDPSDQNVRDIFADIAAIFESNGDKEITDRVLAKYQQEGAGRSEVTN